jgi:aryl-alcohol dehydrogenase-like predicted oxidoreductase
VKHIKLRELDVSRIGLGAMGMSHAYTGAGSDDAEFIPTIQRALELGVTLLDTAEVHGPFANEELVGRAIKGRRDQVVVATKFGMISHTGGGPGVLDSSRPTSAPRSMARCGALASTRSTCTTSTASTLSWLLAGATTSPPSPAPRAARVEENIAADGIQLSAEQIDKFNNLTPAAGDHDKEAQMRMIDR